MKYRFELCLQRGKIVRIPVDRELIVKEMREAEQDLAAAERSFADGNTKWSIIRATMHSFMPFVPWYSPGDTARRAIPAFDMPLRLSMSMKAFFRHRYSKISISRCARVKVRITDVCTRRRMPVMWWHRRVWCSIRSGRCLSDRRQSGDTMILHSAGEIDPSRDRSFKVLWKETPNHSLPTPANSILFVLIPCDQKH